MQVDEPPWWGVRGGGSGCTGNHALAWSVLPWMAEAFGSRPGATAVAPQVAECRRGDERELGSHPAVSRRSTHLSPPGLRVHASHPRPSQPHGPTPLAPLLFPGAPRGSEAPMCGRWSPGLRAWTSVPRAACVDLRLHAPHAECGGQSVRKAGHVGCGERLTPSIQGSPQRD